MSSVTEKRIILGLFLFTVGFAILDAGGRDTWSVALSALLISVNLVLISFRILKKNKTISFSVPLGITALLFIAFNLGLAVYRNTVPVSMPFILKLFLYYTAFISAYFFFDSSSKTGKFLAVLTGIGTAVALMGIILFLYRLYAEGTSHAAATAFYVNKNHFAGLFEILIPCSAALLFFPFNKGEKSVVLYGLIIMSAGLGFSMSRGGWISILIALITYLILLFPFLRKRGLAYSGGIGALIAVLGIGTFYFIGITPLVEKYESTLDDTYLGMRGRVMIWEHSFEAIKEHPGGYGPGMFQYSFQKYRPIGLVRRVAFAHNDYMHAAFELGIVGIIFLIVLIERSYNYLFSAYYYYAGKLKKEDFSHKQPYSHCITRYGLILGIIAMLTSMTVHSLVDFNLHLSANGLIFSILLGIGMRTVSEASRFSSEEEESTQSES